MGEQRLDPNSPPKPKRLQANTITQRKKDEKLITAFTSMEKEIIILDMIRDGGTIHEAARVMGMSTTDVRKLLSSVIAEHQQSLADHAEYVYEVNNIRLENLYRKSMTAAFRGRDAEGLMLDSDRQWAQLALNIIKEQNRMAETRYKTMLGHSTDEDKSKAGNTVNVFAPTLVAGDDMFQVAQNSMSDDFMERHKHRLGPQDEEDLHPDDLLVMNLTTPGEDPPPPPGDANLTEGVVSLEEKLNILEEKLKGMTGGERDEQ